LVSLRTTTTMAWGAHGSMQLQLKL
jgi:hypothetical protein